MDLEGGDVNGGAGRTAGKIKFLEPESTIVESMAETGETGAGGAFGVAIRGAMGDG